MKKTIIFGGTTEGRELSEWLSRKKINHLVCVATDYGEAVLDESEKKNGGTFAEVLTGRMDCVQMKSFMGSQNAAVVVDATHPFAKEVSENIKQAAADQGLQYIRFLREAGSGDSARRYIFEDHESCAEALKNTEGNILLTTGSKNLEQYCQSTGLRERLFVRVLPSAESIALCEKCGITVNHIIAMQGPFSTEMNLALINCFNIKVMVTKQSGRAGGFEEKEKAAMLAGIPLYIIGRFEDESGLSPQEVRNILSGYYGCRKLSISIIGCGMGGPGSLTLEAKRALDSADIIFGAGRLIKGIDDKREKYPYYKADEVLPVIVKKKADAAVLYSGDTGFYSGASHFFEAAKALQVDGSIDAEVKIYPGISSAAALAAAFGISWGDAVLMSIHGKGTAASRAAEILYNVRTNRKVFAILSGLKDIKDIIRLLLDNGLEKCRILAGFQMSYPEEEYFEIVPGELEGLRKDSMDNKVKNKGYLHKELFYKERRHKNVLSEEGLYSIFIINDDPQSAPASCGVSDSEFIRSSSSDIGGFAHSVPLEASRKDGMESETSELIYGSENNRNKLLKRCVPMTKEEIRQICISKLRLMKDSILYDIGSGTGSIAVEAARLSPKLRVFAIERNPQAAELIYKNREKFHAANIEIAETEAPDGLSGLPVPTHAFIGGSGKRLFEILDVLFAGNNAVRVVITVVTLETLQEIMQIKEKYAVEDFEVISVQTARSTAAGKYSLMKAENPVWICSFCGRINL